MTEKDDTNEVVLVMVLVQGETEDQDEFVLVHDTTKMKDDCRLWKFPGGRIKIGETPFKAARRELKEETGLLLRDGIYGHYYGKRYISSKGCCSPYWVHLVGFVVKKADVALLGRFRENKLQVRRVLLRHIPTNLVRFLPDHAAHVEEIYPTLYLRMFGENWKSPISKQ
jgi:8-oxo-dGTP pyrophosphatase MutT (NUDIX family)